MEKFFMHNDEAISTRLFAQWITERYAFSLDKFTQIKEETIEKIISDGNWSQTINLEGNYNNHILVNDDIMVIITQKRIDNDAEERDTYFELFAKDIDTYKKHYDLLIEWDKMTTPTNVVVEYSSFSLGSYGISENCESHKSSVFEEISGDVYEPYLDVAMMFEQFMSSKAPVLQLTGSPGLGKSKLVSLFVKYLLQHPENLHNSRVLRIARPADSRVLADEDFWVQLRQGGFKALILDDIDYILEQRNETVSSSQDQLHNDIINKMLTFTDGLLHQKTKILITTNINYNRIDKALSRDLRLFDSIELRPLRQDEALEVWENRFKLSKAEFDRLFGQTRKITPATLSQAAEGFHHKGDKTEVRQSYCKEEGISKLKDIRGKTDKKMGFL